MVDIYRALFGWLIVCLTSYFSLQINVFEGNLDFCCWLLVRDVGVIDVLTGII